MSGIQEAPRFNIYSRMVLEQRRNEVRLGKPAGTYVSELLRRSIGQAPHRVYFNPEDGSITRGLLYDELNDRFGAFLQRSFYTDDAWLATEEIELNAASVREREELIAKWKEGFNMTGNIVLNPDAVIRVHNPHVKEPDAEYVHFSHTEVGMLYYYYQWGDHLKTPRELGIGFDVALGAESGPYARYPLQDKRRPPIDIIAYSTGLSSPRY